MNDVAGTPPNPGRGAPRKARSRGRKGESDTRMALILAAERIFSEEGISNTPLRRITQAAGQRNESAIHYHFKSREGIVQAILDLRTASANEARVAMVEAFRARTPDAPLASRDLASAMVLPLAAYLQETAGEGHYQRFLGMLTLEQTMLRKFEGRTQDSGLRMVMSALIEAKPHMPELLLRQRFAQCMSMTNMTFAGMERLAYELGPAYDWSRSEIQIENLVDSIAAVFDAPISPQTVRLLQGFGQV